ncbi:MAG: DMT family transporter [Actinomycetota bacterium]
MTRRAHVYAMLGVLALVWGVAFVGIKEVLDRLSPTTLTVLRFAIADVCLLVVMAAWPAARPRLPGGDLWRLVVLGVTGVPGYHLALNWGEQRTSASVASLIVATAPVMVALGSAALLGERNSARRWVGIALAFAGVAVLTLGDTAGAGRTSVAGVLVAMIAPVMWAIYVIVGKPLADRASPIQITTASMLIGSISLLPLLSGRTFREIGSLSAGDWGWMLQLGLGSSVAGYFIFVWALGKMEATKVSVFLYAIPVVALIASWVLLDERLGARLVLAGAMVIAGLVLTQQEKDRPEPLPPVEEPVATPQTSGGFP